MRIDKPENMAVLAQRGEGRAGSPATLSLLLGFGLRPDGRAVPLPEPELWAAAGRALGPTGTLHAGLPEHGAQVLVHGDAWPAPGQERARHVQVGLRVLSPDGRQVGASDGPAIDKRLDVFGDRELDAVLGAGPAQEFEHLPLDLSRAFGGPGHAENPQGRGAAAAHGDAGPSWPMPNVEYPDDRLRRRGQQVRPATLGPLGPLQRALPPDQLAGAAANWLRAWPHAGFAARQQAHAPADQWLPQGLRGDENVELLHLHPLHARLSCQLPALRPRCLWGVCEAGQAGSPSWREFPLRAHTLWLFPQELTGVIVYRAEVDAGFDPGATDAWLLTAWDSLEGPPAPAGEHVRAWELRHPAEPPEPQAAAAPAAPAPVAAAADTAASTHPAPAPRRGPDALTQAREDAIRRLRRNGWSQQQIDELQRKGWLPQAPEQPASAHELLQQLQAQTDALRSQHHLEDADIQRFIQLAGLDSPATSSPGSPQAELAQALRELQQHTQRALSQAGLTEAQANRLLEQHQPETADLLRKLRTPPNPGVTAAAGAAEESARRPQEERDARPAQRPAPTRDDVERWLRDGASLEGRQLDGLDLSGLDFSGTDLRGVLACETRFSGCRMQHVRLDQAVLRDADLSAADLRGACLRDTSCARARMPGACLADADASDADFTQADLQGADLAGATLQRAVFEQTCMRELRAARSDARQAQFAGCDLRHSDWQDARLDGSAWLECDLRGACLRRAEARDINLEDSDASDADLSGADLRGSRATAQTCLQRAHLRQADLQGACWEGARLQQADLTACRLDGADLSRVQAGQACMRGVHASGMRLDDADLRGADLDHAKLLQASLAGADLRGASLVSSLCFGADLGDVRRHPDTLRHADLRRTVLAATQDDGPDSMSGAGGTAGASR